LSALQPARNLLRKRPQLGGERVGVGDIGVEGGLGADALRLAARLDRATVVGAGETIKAETDRAVAAGKLGLVELLQGADGGNSVGGEPRLGRLADAPDERHRPAGEEAERLIAADHRKAARLVEIGGDL